jgi:glutamate--cysteine ligase catalytic subunit
LYSGIGGRVKFKVCAALQTYLHIITCCRGSTLPVFHPEFGRFMLEATPGKPWGIGFKDLLDVEPNMKWR